MIAITPLRLHRLQVDLTEMSAGSAMFLCQIPDNCGELATSEMIARIYKPSEKPRKGEVQDHRLWTVQERSYVIAHYISHVIEEKGNFSIGDGYLSDYLLPEIVMPVESVVLGEVGEKDWSVGQLLGKSGKKTWSATQLLGYMAESIERLILNEDLTADANGWMIGWMGATLINGDLPVIDHTLPDAVIDEQLSARCTELLTMPSSEFDELIERWLHAINGELAHIFHIGFSNDGIVYLPVSGGEGLLPARFPVHSGISEWTRLFFKPNKRDDT